MAVNEQFPSLMPTLYSGPMATDPRPYASLDKMWKAFGDSSNNKTPAVNGDNLFSLPVSSSGVRSSAPSGPRPACHGRSHGRVPSQTPSWQTGSCNNPVVMSVNDPTDPWTDNTSKCWPLEEHHHAVVFAVCVPTTLLSGAPFSHPPPAPLPSEKIGDIAQTARKIPSLSETADTPLLTRAAV